MRIVHVVSYYHIELKYQEYYLVREQIEAGHEVTVITSERKYPVLDYEHTVKSVWGTRVVKSGIEKGSLGETVIRLPIRLEIGARTWLKGLNKNLKQLLPDIVIFHGVVQFHTLPILFSKLQKHARIIIDEHSVMNDYNGSKTKELFFKVWAFFASKTIYKRADKIIGISDSSLEVLKKYYQFKGSKVEMIPLGVDTDMFKPNQILRNAQRQEWGIDEDAFIVLYTGKISKYKYVHLIMDALSEFKTEKKLHLVFVGNINDDYKEQLIESQNSCPFKCHFHTAVNHNSLPSVFNAADIAVWPAHQTISTIEASACGLPIICSDFLTERYKNNNGFGVIPGNLEVLRKLLITFIENNHLRIEMGINGRNMIENEMSWKMISKKYIS
jgi:glycosyltransferase involved in cell wall biosynthesis